MNPDQSGSGPDCLQYKLPKNNYKQNSKVVTGRKRGAQWLSGRVLDSRLRGCRFEPRRSHCSVLEQDTSILA